VDRSSAARLERLEAELHGYKTNLIKESIRMGHNGLGDFYFSRGDLQVCAWALARRLTPGLSDGLWGFGALGL
jgi:hypothetical protein